MAPGAALAEPETPAATTGHYVDVAIEKVFASKTNPRTHFDDSYLEELARSIHDKGLIQPIILRPAKGSKTGWEIVAGECRWRASKKAGLATIAAIVRDYTDEQVLELQLIENIHRQDLTPLEQAVGYRKLIQTNPDKHSAATIAARIGMSEAWVWDRLKLNDLIPEAKTLLETERITTGHAILIARQKPEDQKDIIHVDTEVNRYGAGSQDGLWRVDHSFNFDERRDAKKADKYAGLKLCSVRELESYIHDHVRFDIQHAAKAQPFEFEPVAQQIETAAAKPGRGKKVVAITFDYRCPDDARDDQEETYGREAWKRADGQEKSHTCEFSVLGVVAAGGAEYGKAFEVCVARDKCRVHWLENVRRKEKAEKARELGKTAKPKKTGEPKESSWERENRIRREREEKQEARWKRRFPLLKTAIAEARKKLKAVNGPAYAYALKANNLPAGTKPAELPMVMLDVAIREVIGGHVWYGREAQVVALAKALGVDTSALGDKEDGDVETKPAAKKAKKATR